MFKLLPFWFIAEIAAFWVGVNHFGFWDTMLYWWAPSLIGFIITSSFTKVALSTMQASMMAGQLPEKRILHAGLIFLGGVLCWIPFIMTRVLGLLLILPGSRHLLLLQFKKKLADQIAKGSATGFQFGGFGGAQGGPQMGGFKFYRYDMRTGSNPFGQANEAPRDVTPHGQDILDVKPIEVTHSSASQSTEGSKKS